MYLLKKGNFEFNKILESGYEIDEQPNTIKKVQFVNGRRKRIDTDYIDCIIKINLGGIDNSDIQTYLTNLTDGPFTYWSYKYNQYKTANFLVTLPSIVTDRAYSTSNYYLGDISITLEKSSDVQ